MKSAVRCFITWLIACRAPFVLGLISGFFFFLEVYELVCGAASPCSIVFAIQFQEKKKLLGFSLFFFLFVCSPVVVCRRTEDVL